MVSSESDGSYSVAQEVQMRRTSRCATTPMTADVMRYDSMPMSSSRYSEDTASIACTDENTRWPVSADCTAMRAVSASRTSPTRITSGSWRRIDLRPVANVMPAWSWIWIWLIRGKMYSTGSSIVITFMSRRLISDNVAYNVVVLPLPVGPPTITMPNGADTILE